VDPPSRWERLFLANLQRSAEEWARRQRLVRAMMWALGVLAILLVAVLALAGRLLDLPFLALLAAVAVVVVLLRHLWLYMGILRGAAEREERRPQG
jgi:uncharacterized protein YacL